MQFDDTRWRVIAMVALACFGSLIAYAAPGPTVREAEGAAGATTQFNIPAQPLGAALQEFGQRTGLAVLIDAPLLAGIESSPVQGRYMHGEALQLMLVGTGLAPHYVKEGAFTLVPVDAAPDTGAVDPDAASTGSHGTTATTAARARGARIIQRSLEQALCASLLARPGSYRAGVRFWLDGQGRIQHPELFESSGDDERDDDILRRLDGLPLAGVPGGLPQPVMLLLLPESEGSTPPCARRR